MKLSNVFRLLAAVCLLWVALAACRKERPAPAPAPLVAERPTRVVSFVPSLTEVAFDLGLGPSVVGVSSFDTWPPEVAGLEKLGGVVDPNLEKLLALEPDLILTTPSVKGVEELARREGIAVVSLRTDSLPELLEAYRRVGAAAGVPELGQRRARELEAELEALRPSPSATRPRVLLVVGRDQGALSRMFAAGRGSFLDELLVMAGGENALPETLGAWPQVSREFLIAQAPDLVIEFAPGGTDAEAETRKAREAWGEMSALGVVKAERVHRLVGSHLLLPGPRVVQTLRALREVLSR